MLPGALTHICTAGCVADCNQALGEDNLRSNRKNWASKRLHCRKTPVDRDVRCVAWEVPVNESLSVHILRCTGRMGIGNRELAGRVCTASALCHEGLSSPVVKVARHLRGRFSSYMFPLTSQNAQKSMRRRSHLVAATQLRGAAFSAAKRCRRMNRPSALAELPRLARRSRLDGASETSPRRALCGDGECPIGTRPSSRECPRGGAKRSLRRGRGQETPRPTPRCRGYADEAVSASFWAKIARGLNRETSADRAPSPQPLATIQLLIASATSTSASAKCPAAHTCVWMSAPSGS